MIGTIREIWREMRAKKWLAVGLAAEALAVAASIGSISAVSFLPITWTLSVAGILSTTGILIVTAHYVWEYNRRPLNSTQRGEVEGLLTPYLLSEDVRSLATKSELSTFVPESKLFWLLRYQQSVMELAWTADASLRTPGYVIVAELSGTDPLTKKVDFTLVPPPIENPKECLSTMGEEPPFQFGEWGALFHEFGSPIVFFQSHDRKIKYLRANQNIVFDEHLSAPIPVPRTETVNLPELQRTNKAGAHRRGDYPYEWRWEAPPSE